jgi:alpha-glucoside transport system substrate-binding protein
VLRPGWPATDWVREVVLGHSGSQIYDDWVSHKVKFIDPPIISAMQTVAGWMQNPACWCSTGRGVRK